MKLVVITDSGEQIEARCDGCMHWGAYPQEDMWDNNEEWRFADAHAGAKHCAVLNGKVAEAYCVHDGVGIATLYTLPSFGCALFESKETA